LTTYAQGTNGQFRVRNKSSHI